MGYVAGVRLYETALANVFLWAGGVVLYPYYDRGKELWGISPEGDQALAGAVMLIEGSLVTLGALAWLFLRLAQEASCARSCSSAARSAGSAELFGTDAGPQRAEYRLLKPS